MLLSNSPLQILCIPQTQTDFVCRRIQCEPYFRMSLAEVKEQALALPVEEQAELACLLAGQFRRDEPEYREMLARLIDNKDASRWVKWDELKKKLDHTP